jgi:hypothetical protein
MSINHSTSIIFDDRKISIGNEEKIKGVLPFFHKIIGPSTKSRTKKCENQQKVVGKSVYLNAILNLY